MPRGRFPHFIAALRRSWATTLPSIQPVDRTLSPLMPKASTFYVCLDEVPTGLASQVFLRFQHHSKVWNAGSFAINVIVSAHYGPPRRVARRLDQFARGEEGIFRIHLMPRTGPRGTWDKWWRLAPPMFPETADPPGWWAPSSYDDESVVFAEAIDDVTREVRQALALVAARHP